MYQQSMMRAEEIRRRRREDPQTTHTAVNNILAAAAREMEEAMHANRAGERVVASIQTEHDQGKFDVNFFLYICVALCLCVFSFYSLDVNYFIVGYMEQAFCGLKVCTVKKKFKFLSIF